MAGTKRNLGMKDLYYANDNWDLALYTCNENGRYRYVIYAELMQY